MDKPLEIESIIVEMTCEVPPPKIDKTLIEDILDIETNKILTNIILDKNEISILKELISLSPDSLNDINKCILEIIKDGKIDALDIPSFIKIVKDIYILCHQKITIKVSNLIESIGSILKYILQIVLIKNSLITLELVKSIDGLIDMAVDMIKLHSSFKTKTCYFKLC
jgi:hypothetical protein